MGIFTYSRFISSAIMRKNVNKTNFYIVSPPSIPMLASTPNIFTAHDFSSFLDEMLSIEEKIKKAFFHKFSF